eukprot:2563631-Pleurochrysis_carterae.AAC.5
MAEEGRAQPIWCRCLTSGMLLCLARYSAAGSVRLSRRRFEYAIGAARAGKEAGRSRGQCRLRAYDLEEAPRKEAEGAAALLPSSVWRRRAVPTTCDGDRALKRAAHAYGGHPPQRENRHKITSTTSSNVEASPVSEHTSTRSSFNFSIFCVIAACKAQPLSRLAPPVRAATASASCSENARGKQSTKENCLAKDGLCVAGPHASRGAPLPSTAGVPSPATSCGRPPASTRRAQGITRPPLTQRQSVETARRDKEAMLSRHATLG